MMREIISRFAPAPTGYLHLGHVVNAIYVWGVTRRSAGRVLLRIEDHDRQRSRAEYDRALLDDLAWLGFQADGGAVRQSGRGAIYAAALQRLRDGGRIYACSCSRADLAAAADETPDETGERRYPGTCRDRGLADGPGRVLRVRLDPVDEQFEDLRHGRQTQRPSDQCGDFVVRDRDGNWTYQFAATVVDCVQEVSLIIRGDDLLASTGRQLQLARLLGRETPPRFLHHPLIMKSPSQKLSKSDGDTGVRDLREHGWTPARVIGHAAFLAGLVPRSGDVAAADVAFIMQPIAGL
jgi:glutamyl-tRNA synthetase/glutamyl-Q tRNA(Asp) synthetase